MGVRIFGFEYASLLVDELIWIREVFGNFGVTRKQPFLDRRVVEAVFSVDSSSLVTPGINKPLLREVLQSDLPANVLQRKHKVGFDELIWAGIGSYGAEREKVEQLFDDRALIFELGYVDAGYFLRMLQEEFWANTPSTLNSPMKYWLWQAIGLESWLQAINRKGLL
jgi:hypothetical protein